MNYEIAMAIQKISTGEVIELTRGEVAEYAIDLNKWLKDMSAEQTEKCRTFYEKMISDQTKADYNAEKLMDEITALEKEFKDFIYNDSDDQFIRMKDATEELLMNSPLEGLDGIAYGVAELCVISLLEHFACKKLNLSHDLHRTQYYNILLNSTAGEAVANRWITVYDDLHRRYESFEFDVSDEISFKTAVITGSLIALSAMKEPEDKLALDFAQAKAREKAEMIIAELESKEYTEGLSDTVDNAIDLLNFVSGFFIG